MTRRGNPASGPAEQQLEEALFRALPDAGIAADLLGARRLRIRDDWEPVPDGIDFYVWAVRPGGDVALIAELKFDDVEQRMWDLFKVLAARKLPGSPVGLLVHGGSWTAPKPCADLFPDVTGATVEIDALSLVRGNAVQWEKDLRYSARVLAAPERVRCTSCLAGLRMKSYPGYELRVVEVEPADDSIIRFQDGWPV